MRGERATAIAAGLLTVWAACSPGGAGAVGEYKEYFVSPTGRPDGDGTRARPLDLTTALSAGSPARPGDTVWLLGGTYKGAFTSHLSGTEQEPILVRQAPRQRATIDCHAPGDKLRLFTVKGQWTTFWGFEVTCSDPTRVTKTAGSHPKGIRRGGIHCLAPHIRFVNLAVHDCGSGFGFWSGGEGGEIHGCIIYNNGWQGPDRGHGHGIYTQNRTGTKRLVDNIIFNQFGYGIHAYGSARASLDGFHVEGNVCFNNGSLSHSPAPNILVGGGCPARRIKLLGNFTYHADLRSTSVRLGYDAPNEDLTFEDNYCVGGVSVKWWRKIDGGGNTFVSSAGLLGLLLGKGFDMANCRWDENAYYAPGAARRRGVGFSLVRDGRGQVLNFAAWRKQTALDGASSYAAARPKGVEVFVRPNRYQLGRAHVIVCNWAGREAVEVDLRHILKIGARYEVLNAEDYFGAPVVSGRYEGKPVRIPLRAARPAPPVGMPAGRPPPAGPTFNVFVLRGT